MSTFQVIQWFVIICPALTSEIMIQVLWEIVKEPLLQAILKLY